MLWILRVLIVTIAASLAAAPAFASEAQRLERKELEALRSRHNPNLPITRGGSTTSLNAALAQAERNGLRLVRAEIRHVQSLEELRAGDVETGLSVVTWIIIGVGVGLGVVLLVTLILIFTI